MGEEKTRQGGMRALIKTGSGPGVPTFRRGRSLRSRRWRGSKPDGAQRLVAQAKRDANAPHSSSRVVQVVQAKLHSRRDQAQDQGRSRNAVSHSVSDAGGQGAVSNSTPQFVLPQYLPDAFQYQASTRTRLPNEARLSPAVRTEASTANTSHTPSSSPPRP